MPPAAAGEEVDGRREERQERGDEDELERPAVEEAGPEVDVGLGAARDLGGLVERAEERLRGEAELAEPLAAQGRERVALGRPRPAGARRDRDRRDAAGDERRLLVEAEREGEVDELRERRPGASARRPDCGADGGVGRGDERRARDPRRVAAELDARGRPPADADEVDDGGEAVARTARSRRSGRPRGLRARLRPSRRG